MLNARGVFRACRQLAVYRLKIVKTFPKTVLPSKCWHCVVLQLYLRGKIVFSGLALNKINNAYPGIHPDVRTSRLRADLVRPSLLINTRDSLL